MKSQPLYQPLSLIRARFAALLLASSIVSGFAQPTGDAAQDNPADEVYAELKVGTKTYKQVEVVSADPIHVTIRFDGGMDKIRRKDLPAPLKEKYPFDASEASEWEALLQTKVQKRSEATRQDYKRKLRAKEVELEARIKSLESTMAALNGEIRERKRVRGPRGSANRQRTQTARDERVACAYAIRDARAMLEQVRAAINATL